MSLVDIKSDLNATPKSMFDAGRPMRLANGFTAESAFECGQNWRAHSRRTEEAATWLQANGEYFAENLDWTLSPTTSAAIIQQREHYGAFERNARVLPVANTVVRLPRIEDGVSGYWVATENAITEDEIEFGSIEFNLRKLGVLIRVSEELDEDSVADFGQIVTNMVAREFARMIDEAGFNGDGTSTYGHHTGLSAALHSSATKTASTNTISDLTQADWEGVANLLEDWDDQPKWFLHRKVFVDSIIQDHNELVHIDGGRTFFLGSPVEFVNVMPTSGASKFLAFYGHLDKAATLATHGSIRVQHSDERYMDTDMVAIRAIQRMSLVVHERGDSDRRRCIVGLKSAA